MQPFTAFHDFATHDALRAALVERGIPATLYQDGTSGGLLCVRVNLTADDSEYAPHVLINTEGTTNQYGGISWDGSVYGVGTEEDVYDVQIHLLQRAGDDEADVARRLETHLRLLRAGAEALVDLSSSASRQHHVDTGNYLLHGQALTV